MGNPIPSRDAQRVADALDDALGFLTENERPILMQHLARFEAQIRADAYEQAAKDSTNEGLAELLREARECIEGEFGTTKLVERIDTALSTGRQA